MSKRSRKNKKFIRRAAFANVAGVCPYGRNLKPIRSALPIVPAAPHIRRRVRRQILLFLL